MKNMINSVNGKRELDRVNMLIRALSDEMTQERTPGIDAASRKTIPAQIQEALYELRLSKLLISALVSSDRATSRSIRH